MKKIIFGMLSGICFFSMLFWACALDSASNVPLVLTISSAVGMFLFGIPAGIIDIPND